MTFNFQGPATALLSKLCFMSFLSYGT